MRRVLAAALRLLAACAVAAAPASLAASGASDQLIQRAERGGLARADTWAALLHVHDGTPNIRDPGFLLTSARFSLDAELAATIRFLYDGPAANVCRFPARYAWLQRSLHAPELPTDQCTDLVEFRRRAPADSVALAFASENLAQPSSMMGHLFLKLAGTNHEQVHVDHAISFFTDGASWNLPKLLFDSMVLGMPGFFTLSPYEEKARVYLAAEQRSLWEYELDLDAFQRALLHNHLHELKQADLTYFFQKYNCATVINFVLSVGTGSGASFSEGLWVTPKDVIKRAQALGVVKSSTLASPSRWLVRALREQLPRSMARQVKADVDRRTPVRTAGTASAEEFVQIELAKAYHSYRREKGRVSGAEADDFADALSRAGARYSQALALQPADDRSPLATPPDSQIEIGGAWRGTEPYARLTFTPSSHRLEDDNRQYFGETELTLFEVSLLQSLRRPALELDRLMIYSAKSLVPYDGMSGGVSGHMRIGVEPQLDERFRPHRTAVVAGGLGRTLRVVTDIDVFVLLGGGVSYGNRRADAYASPEAGVVVREVFGMKSVATLTTVASIAEGGALRHALHVTQSKYFAGQRYSLHVRGQVHARGGRRFGQFEASVKKLF